MTEMLVTVLLICMSHCVYSKSYREPSDSHDDIVECVFAIKINSSILITKERWFECIPFSFCKQILQNIGKIEVQVTTILSNVTVDQYDSMEFYFPMRVYNFNKNYRYRAIVYASDCNKDNKDYIKDPEQDYDKNKVLRGAFTLGVKYIPKCRNLSTLISTFWPENKDNVWQQIYAVIEDLLDVQTQQIISKTLNEDIKNINEEMLALNKMTRNDMTRDFDKKYVELMEKLENIETRFILEDHEIFNLYIIPLYGNVVTMKLYFYALGLTSHKMHSKMFDTICHGVRNQSDSSFKYLLRIGYKALDKIYNTVYAGGLYNVMMNARSHFAWHALELIPKWNEVYTICMNIEDRTRIYHLLPISYSNLYGKATPDLLQQAINIDYTRIEGSIMRIDFYIKGTKKKTVYGLELLVMPYVYFGEMTKFSMGTCKLAFNIRTDSLDLRNKTIIKLKVYRTRYIRCLEFILSDNCTSRFGDHCEGNYSKNMEFHLEGHHINSLYLANDYPKTGKYFDNVAVSFLPNPL